MHVGLLVQELLVNEASYRGQSQMVAEVEEAKLNQKPKKLFHNSPLGGGYGLSIVYTIIN